MTRKTETQKLQEYADEIWGVGRMEIVYEGAFKGYYLMDGVAFPDVDCSRSIGRNAAEAHAELDAMADMKRAQE